MSTIKISQLPALTSISSNTQNTLFIAVDLPTNTTGKLTGKALAQGLFANDVLNVGNNAIVYPNVIGQFAGNSNTYIQINLQNFNSNGSSDFVASTSDSDNSNSYIDFGISGKTFSDPVNYGAFKAYDGYVYVYGPSATSAQGNLIIGTASTRANIVFMVGGLGTDNIVGRVSNSSFDFLKPVYVTGNVKTTGSFILSDGSVQTTAWTGSVSSLVNGARTVSLGSDGTVTLPSTVGDIKRDGVGLFASLVFTTNNMWNVDPSRTDTYTANGSVLKPFKTIAAALAYIEAKIADTSLTISISGTIVDNPQFIFLKTSITENITLTRGNIFIVGDTPDAGHVPIWINGYVDIVPADSSGNAINVNRFGLFHVAVKPSTANHAIQVTGVNPSKLFLEDVHAYQNDATKSCVYANNTGTGSRVEMYDCTMARASGSVYLIDIQRGFCSINNLETNGTGQVLNQANDSTGNMLRSTIDANTGSVITLSGSVQWGMGEVILTNTGTGANTYGVSMSGSATMQFGVCTFNVSAAQATNRAINGVAGNMVLYSGPIFQYGSTNKISSAITLIPLTTTFTAV
jgi:hypothetical protein